MDILKMSEELFCELMSHIFKLYDLLLDYYTGYKLWCHSLPYGQILKKSELALCEYLYETYSNTFCDIPLD